jgi:hypothetical protein
VHTTHTHFQQFIWFKTTNDSASREVVKLCEKIYILPDRGPDRHGVLRVLPTIWNNRHEHHGIGNGQTVADPVANAALQNNEWRGAKKPTQDRRFK